MKPAWRRGAAGSLARPGPSLCQVRHGTHDHTHVHTEQGAWMSRAAHTCHLPAAGLPLHTHRTVPALGELTVCHLDPALIGHGCGPAVSSGVCVRSCRRNSSWWTVPRTSTTTAAKGTCLMGGPEAPRFPLVGSVGPGIAGNRQSPSPSPVLCPGGSKGVPVSWRGRSPQGPKVPQAEL